jgi:GT2 family glycosyltransferase
MSIGKINIDISIVIVNYKSWKHLENCLNSINKIISNEFSLEVIIVDNCSHDHLFEVFKKKFPQFIFIENTGNNGFANGCNLGAKSAKGNYFLFLNPDTIISEEPILKMYSFLKGNKNIGIVSCNQLNTSGFYEKNIRFFLDLNTLFGLFRALNKKKLSARILQKDNVLYPDWVSGAIVFMSRDWFHKVHGWDEDFWMYYEDVNLSKKVSDVGGIVALLTNTEIIHNHGGSSRINIKTASITKTEVLISKHVYIRHNYTGIKHFILQFLVVMNNLIGKILAALIGVLFFFIPKLKLNVYLCFNIIKYYASSVLNRTWLSNRSLNYPNKNNC